VRRSSRGDRVAQVATLELLWAEVCAQNDARGWLSVTWEPARRLRDLERAIWAPRRGGLPAWKALAVRTARLAIVLFRDVMAGQLTLRAMSLVYTTLLSMVPLLALSFSVLKAFGVHNRIEPMLGDLLAPLGDQGQEITSRLVEFIDHMNVGVLGSVGLALLVYTVVSLMEKIEESFNSIWRVGQLRSLGERYSRYLSLLLVGPILVFSAVGITAIAFDADVVRAILAIEPFGGLLVRVGKLTPYALVIGAFTFAYLFVPNARVRFVPALLGGIAGGVLWQSAGWAFAMFVASSTSYAAIYSSFAILVLFLIWLYVSWLILLFGADFAFYLQHPECLYATPGEPQMSNRMRERVAFAAMAQIASHFAAGRRPWTLQQLAQRLAIPMHSLSAVLGALEERGLLTRNHDDPPAYLPARELSDVSINELMCAIRAAGENRFVNPQTLVISGPAEDLVRRAEQAAAASLANVTVRALLMDDSRAAARTVGVAEDAADDRAVRVGKLESADSASRAS
jgi:membrane protein